MKTLFSSPKLRAFYVSCSSLLLLGACPLTDQQLTAIAESAISTGLNAVIRSFVDALVTASGV